MIFSLDKFEASDSQRPLKPWLPEECEEQAGQAEETLTIIVKIFCYSDIY